MPKRASVQLLHGKIKLDLMEEIVCNKVIQLLFSPLKLQDLFQDKKKLWLTKKTTSVKSKKEIMEVPIK
jgi:hypothetical protein